MLVLNKGGWWHVLSFLETHGLSFFSFLFSVCVAAVGVPAAMGGCIFGTRYPNAT